MSRHEYVKKKQVFCERQEKWAICERDDLKNSGFDFFLWFVLFSDLLQ